jgi:hypothetical protein
MKGVRITGRLFAFNALLLKPDIAYLKTGHSKKSIDLIINHLKSGINLEALP